MKLDFFVESYDGMDIVKARSDKSIDDCDLFDLLLSGDLSSLDQVDEFKETVFIEKNEWWFNASKVTVLGESAVIQAAFDADASVTIKLEQLKKIVNRWKVFLENRIPVCMEI